MVTLNNYLTSFNLSFFFFNLWNVIAIYPFYFIDLWEDLMSWCWFLFSCPSIFTCRKWPRDIMCKCKSYPCFRWERFSCGSVSLSPMVAKSQVQLLEQYALYTVCPLCACIENLQREGRSTWKRHPARLETSHWVIAI